jgi:hypothetical protein
MVSVPARHVVADLIAGRKIVVDGVVPCSIEIDLEDPGYTFVYGCDYPFESEDSIYCHPDALVDVVYW